ncbi:hypothetical protein [Rhodocista pekingensis]|uniref:Uncharacterized protein n=1 Tax=Rhodocista pekingensis TaxID=201185 RepID=A0ABW2KZQ7_9PROT
MTRPGEPPSYPAPSGLTRSGWLLIGVLLTLLALAVALAVRAWTQGAELAGEAGDIPLAGGLALLLGVVGTLALGGGLMALVFFSARSGHDDAVQDEARLERRRRGEGGHPGGGDYAPGED